MCVALRHHLVLAMLALNQDFLSCSLENEIVGETVALDTKMEAAWGRLGH